MSTYAAPPNTSYDKTTEFKDISPVFNRVMQLTGGLLPYLSVENSAFFGEDKKLFWAEHTTAPTTDILNNGGAVAAADTSFTVTNGSLYSVNSVIKFDDYLETMTVTAITGNVLTVTRNTNGVGATTTVADGARIMILYRPEKEFARINEVGITQPTTEYNAYLKLLETVTISAEMMKTRGQIEDGESLKARNIQERLLQMRNQLNYGVLFGERHVGAVDTATQMRGVYTWLMQAGTNKTSGSGGALTATMINNIIADVYTDDVLMSNVILFMDEIQARAMATFNTTLANQLKTVEFTQQMAAGQTYVTSFIGDLREFGLSRIVVDRSAQPGTVAVLNLAKMALVYAPDGAPRMWDSKTNEYEPSVSKTSLLLQATLKMANHTQSHGLLYDLKKTL